MKKKYITTNKLEKKFDSNEDISEYFDMDNSKRPGLEIKRINVDFPKWMIHSLDNEAKRLGVTRQSVIKFWISEKLDMEYKAPN
jgi:hypothetical protein